MRGEGWKKCTHASDDVADVTVLSPLGEVAFRRSSEASRPSYGRCGLRQQGLLLVRDDFQLAIWESWLDCLAVSDYHDGDALHSLYTD